ncbi:MAG: T9SS type A sorting domain-containing protein [Bacteroidales bacterium]|nr:T9SS type A sorting domain-containing protein [Bacteroidales bacterium]
MKKVLLLLIAFTAYCTLGWAQLGVGQQMQNNNFESWRTESGSGNNARVAPNGWNSLNSGTGTYQSTAAKNFVSQSSGNPGGTGSYCVQLQCVDINLLITTVHANGGLSNGRFNAGSMSASDPENCTYTSTNTDYQQVLTAYPDSVYVWTKTSISNSSHNARINIVLHNNTIATSSRPEGNNSSIRAIYQDPAPGNSNGGVVKTTGTVNEQKVVAKAELNFRSQNTWTQQKIAFDYNTYASNNTTPSYILATFSTNASAGTGTGGDKLWFDDVVLIYNTRLATLTVNGDLLAGFNADVTSYNYPTPICEGVVPNVAGTCQSAHASTQIMHNPTVAEPYTTIRVKHWGQENTVYKDYTIYYTIVSAPAAPSITSTPVCAPAAQNVTMSAYSEGATNYRWYTTESGSSYTEGSSFTVYNLLGTATYYVSALNSIGCESGRTPATAIVAANPNAPIAGNTTPVCSGGTGIFTATLPAGDNLVCRWYATNNSSEVIGTGTSLEVNNLTQTTTRYAETYNSSTGCYSINRTAVTVTVNSIPAVPNNLEGGSHCGTGTVSLSASPATGTICQWFAAETGGNALGSGNSFTTPSIASTTNYYVASYNESTGCSSARQLVTATINDIPTAPTAGNTAAVCPGEDGIFTATLPSGNNLQCNWYETSNSSTVIGTATSLTVNNLTQNTSRFVSTVNTATGCESDRTEVTVNVKSVPDAPTLVDNSRCGSGDVTLTVSNPLTSTTYTWYDANNTQVGTGSSYTAQNLASTSTYSVTATTDGCTGASATVTATINSVPASPEAQDVELCEAGATILSVSNPVSGYNYKWYNAAAGGEALHTGESFNVTISNSPSNYYVESISTEGCTSAQRTEVTATISGNPSAPIVPNVSRCGSGNITINVSNPNNAYTYKWYNAAEGGVVFHTGNSYEINNLQQDVTYYVSVSMGNCESNRTAATAHIKAIPDAPSLAGDSHCGTGDVTLNVLNVLNDVTYTWYNVNDEQVNIGTEYTIQNLASTTSYYVTATADGCTGASASVTATIHSIPALPAVTAGARCGAGEVNLSATAGENGNQVRWYAAAEGGEALSTENNFTTPSINTTTSYYVASYNSNTQCFGARQEVVATINSIPAVPVAEDATLCGPGVATLTAVPAEKCTCQWFNANSAEITNGVSADSKTLTTGNLSGNTIFYVRSIDPITSCNSANTTVQVIIASVPGFPSTANVARCGAGAITLTATPNTANTCRWYNAESELVYEGTSFEIANLEETTTFTCKSYNSETGCESSNSRSVIATINPIPDVPTVNGNNPICGSGAIQMTGVPGTNATVCRWINGNDTTTNNSFSTGNISQSTDYLVQSYNANTRCASDNITVSVVVNSLPTAPQTGNDSQCLGTEVTLTATAAEHSIVRWYASAQDNNILYEGSEFHPANLVVGENNFYASAYDTLTQCSSAERTMATATMIDAPSTPDVADTAHCGPAAFTLSIINPQNNTTYKWYTVAQGGEAAHVGTTFTTNELSSTTHYYVSAAVANYDCESGRKEVTVTINNIPANPTVNGNEAICAGQTLTVSASSDAAATNFVWSDGQLSSEGPSFTTPILYTNTNYTVKAYNADTHCESEEVSFTVVVNQNPEAPEASPVTLCQNETAVLSAVAESGNTCYWYASEDATTSISSGDSYSPSDLNVGNTSFYVSQRNNQTYCEGPRTAVVATVYPTYAVNYPVTACDSFRWNNELFTESNNYERTLQTIHGCDSVVTLQLTINQSKVTNIDTTVCDAFVWNGQTYENSGYYQQSFTTIHHCDSTVYVHLTVKKSTTGSDHIYLCSNEIPYNYNNLFTVNGAGTFTIHTDNAAGCDSTITLTVTVNTQPSPAINLTDAARCGEGNVSLTAHAGQNGNTCRWYASEDATDVLATGTQYTISNLSTTTTYYVSSYNDYNGHPCESGRQAITATINTIPDVPAVADQVRCGDGSVEFTATIDENATTCRWYLTLNTTNISATALTYTPNVSVNIGSTSFFVESYNENTGCKSSRKEVKAEAFAIPAAPVLSAMSNCGPQQFSINAPASGYYKWYDNAESTTVLDINNNTTPMVNSSRSYFISHAMDYAGISCESGKSELALTIYPVYEAQTLYDTLCQGQTYTQHGLNETFNQAGSFDRVLNTVSSTNCDSLVTLKLYVKEIRSYTFDTTVCDSYSWNNETFTESENIIRHFTSSIGCDSVVTVNLTVNKSVQTSFEATDCDEYTWNNTTYNASGDYVQHFNTVNGCDSMVTLHLTINNSVETQFSDIACDSYQWNNETYTTSGDYVQHFNTSKGCDSTVTLHLTINYSNAATLTDVVCAGTRYNANGFDTTFNVSGSYTLVRHDLNQAGCDSTTTLTLTVNPIYNRDVTLTICETALPYTWNDITYPGGSASGDYEHTFSTHTAAGCDSIVTLHLTISHQYITPLTADICEGETYPFDGQILSQSGIYYDTLQATNLCDSIIKLTLTVHELHTTNLEADICLGETYNEYGFNETPATSGTFNYQQIVETSFGCDSTINLTLTVNPVYSVTEYDTICADELPYAWQAQQINQEGTYTANHQTINGCDSIITLYLTVNPTYNLTENEAICQNQLPYSWRDTVFAEGTISGEYVFNRSTVNGCDSIVTLTLTVNPVYDQTESETICQNDLPYTWRDTVFEVGTVSGDYVFNRSTVYGCDSIVTLTLTVNPSFTQSESAIICQNELPYIWRDTVFEEETVSGDYVFNRSTVNGCDSIVTLTLTVNPSYTQNENVIICQNELPYTWRDTVFEVGSVSGNYVFNRSSVNGCDSIVTLTLTVNPSKHTDLYAEICEGDVYEYNNRPYDVQNDYNFTFQTILGCDSTVTLHLTVNPVYNIDTNINICQGLLPYTFADTVFYGSGRKDILLHTQHGCDSIYHVNLTVTPFITSSRTVAICDNELPYSLEDSTFYQAGIYEVTVSHNDGCNEIITLTLNVNPTYNDTLEATVCDRFVWNNEIYTESGIYTQYFRTIKDCDSTVTYNLTVNYSQDTLLTPVICEGESYTENGFNRNPENAGIVYDTLHLQCVGTGCDSTVYLELTVNPSYNLTETETICQNELPYTWRDTVFAVGSSSGDYVFNRSTVNGCDSIVTLTLTVNPVYEQTEDEVICANELPFTWRDTVFAEGTISGEYVFNRSTVNGCDSIVTLTLTVNPIYNQTENEDICTNELPYTWRDTVFAEGTVSGEYVFNRSTINGCDSTVTLNLTVNPVYNQTESEVICANELPFTWRDTVFAEGTVSGEYVFNRNTVNGCDSTVTLTLTVNPIFNQSESATICQNELPYTWRDTIFAEGTVSGDYVFNKSTVNGCDSIVTLTLTVNPSYTQSENETICQVELPYTWRDTVFAEGTVSGDYVFNRSTVNGCDSTVTLHLTVNPNNEYYDNPVTFCEGGSYIWNGQTITESGLYTDTVDNDYGCYDVYKVEVTVNPVYSFTEYDTVCANELPIVWQGRTIGQGGTHTADYHTATGCDSIYTLTLTVNPIYLIPETATVCDNEEYVWEGHNVEIGILSEGTYTIWDSLQTINGCDSVYQLTLIVTPTFYAENTGITCNNEAYVWEGHNVEIGILPTGTYTIWDSLNTTTYGCDSVYKLTLTVTPTFYAESTGITCDNEAYVWEGHNVEIGTLQAGTYTIWDSLTTATYGCDSVYKLTLTVTPTFYEEEEATVCDNEEYVWEGHDVEIGILQAGTYTIWDSLTTTTYECDSVYKLTLTVTPTFYAENTGVTCDNEAYVWEGHNVEIGILQAGTYTIWDSLTTTTYGCDSVYKLTLTVTPTFYAESTGITCDNEAYVWEGHNVDIGILQAGTYTIWDSLNTTTYGCDSVYKLTLTVNPTQHSVETASACSNEAVYSWHHRDITATGIYYDTLSTALSCDSVCELHFTLLEPTAAIFADTTCANALYQGYGFEVTPTLSGDTTLVRVTENMAGCDSTITVNLYVKPLATFAFDTIVCGAFQWNNQWYMESGSYQQSFTATNGCDSIVTMNLTIDTPSTDTIEVVACESYEWDGTTYTQSGVFTKVYPQTVGCDSIAVMILTINHVTEVTLYDTTCQAHRYQEYGFDTLLIQVGTITLQRIDENQAGCDSIINLVLTVHRGYMYVDSASTCDNDDFVWHGIHCDTTGIYYKNYETVHGCDSVYILFLTVYPSYEVEVTDTAIAGTPYHNHGLNFTPQNPGILNIDVPRTTVDGCDSTIHVTLVVVEGTGIDMHYLDKHITLFPNPTDNVFTVSSTLDIIRELTIYDNNGRAVLQQNIYDYSGQVNVESLTPGIYFVRMMTPDNIVTKKLIVR